MRVGSHNRAFDCYNQSIKVLLLLEWEALPSQLFLLFLLVLEGISL